MLVEKYGKLWNLSDNPDLGQLGLLDENHYRRLFDPIHPHLALSKKDVWLDIGANIGAFAIRAASEVDVVVAVEPEPTCLQRLESNLTLNDITNVITLEAAVVGDDSSSVSLALSNSYSSTHRVGKIRGRKTLGVPAININTLVKEHGINKIKMDCEGSEVEILEAIDLEPIDEVIFEYHFSFVKDRPWERYFAIMDKFKSSGFTTLRGPKVQTGTWHAIVWVKKL